MISIVNEAINRKLASMSFTNIIVGKVESVQPLQIRINDRIVIGQSFIEPMSLGLNDYSPNSALPLVVGEKIQMVRYNNGQRFYVLGKTVAAEAVVVDYKEQVVHKPVINTTVATKLEPVEIPIEEEVVLHKISRTGSFSDLLDKPKLNTNNSTSLTVNSVEEINGTIKLHKIAKTGKFADLVGTANILTTDTEQTISAKKTFGVLPESSVTPTSDNQLINKSYVDTNFLQYDVIEEF